jgi:hypothetical protein
MSIFKIDPRSDIDNIMNDKFQLFTNSYEKKIENLESNIEYSIMVKKEASNQQIENVALISDIFGNINMIQIDLLTIGYYTLYEKRILPKMYLARQAALLIYETLRICEKFRGTFRRALKHHDNDLFIEKLKKQSEENKAKVVKFGAKAKQYLEKIRHYTIAHRDPDFEKQINVMKEVDPYTLIGLSMEFESIIQDLNDILNSYLSRYVRPN